MMDYITKSRARFWVAIAVAILLAGIALLVAATSPAKAATSCVGDRCITANWAPYEPDHDAFASGVYDDGATASGRPAGTHCRKAWAKRTTQNFWNTGLYWTRWSQGYCWKGPNLDGSCNYVGGALSCGHLTYIGPMEVNGHVTTTGLAGGWGYKGVVNRDNNWFRFAGHDDGGHGSSATTRYFRCLEIGGGCFFPAERHHWAKVLVYAWPGKVNWYSKGW